MTEYSVSETRRQEILTAAIYVFNRDGFHKATLEDVALEVGISKSLIYYHFKNKMEVLAQLYKMVGETLNSRLIEVFDGSSMSPIERLRRVIETHVDVIIEHQNIFQIYFREKNEISRDTLDRLVAHGDSNYVKRLKKLLDDGAKQGVFNKTDSRITAFAIVGACNWIAFWYQPESKRGTKKLRSNQSIADTIYQTVAIGLVISSDK